MCRFNYGRFTHKNVNVGALLRTHMLAKRMPLTQALQCGINVALLAQCGITISELARIYMLEDIIRVLKPDWQAFKALRFSPQLLVDVVGLPLIVLYDLLGMRAWHLLEFDISREALRRVLGASGWALMRVNELFWPSERLAVYADNDDDDDDDE